MQQRSWMAAWALAAIVVFGSAARLLAEAPPVVNQVKLQLEVTGLSQGECEIEVKPANAGCEFPTLVYRVEGLGKPGRPDARVRVTFKPMNAQCSNADRECSFAITLREPGQPPKTYHRGLRLKLPEASGATPSQTLTCYLSSPSLAAREASERKSKR